jgi:hypothetical protein
MATETFTGANGASLPAGWAAVNGTFEILNNTAVATVQGAGANASVAVKEFSESDITLTALCSGGGSASSLYGVVFRYSALTDYWIAGINSTGLVQLYSRIADVYKVEDSFQLPSYSASTYYEIEVDLDGNNIAVSIDGVERIPFTSTHNNTATQHGFRFGVINAHNVDTFTSVTAATNTITLDIADRQVWQDTGAGKTITVSGTASTANVEYQLDGGAWTTGGATTTGNYSFSLALTRGNHDLSVRCAEDTEITATATKIGVLDVFEGAGQSNMSGFGAPSQTFAANGNFDCTLLGNDDVYKLMADPWDSNTSQVRGISSYANAAGSWMVHFANQYVLDKSESLCVVPNSIGSVGIDRWQKTDTTRVGGLNLYEAMAQRIALTGGCKLVFMQGGESNIAAGMDKTTYKNFLNQFVDDVFADFGVKTWIVPFGNLSKDGAYDGNGTTTGQIPLRAAQTEVAAENANAEITQPLDDIDLSNEDGLHFQTTPILTEVGTRVYQSYTNTGPTANAGHEQSVNAGANVTLTSASSTDGDGTIASRLWQQTGGDSVTLSDDTATAPTFTAPSTNAQQNLTFTVTVTDDDGATDTDTVVITVAAFVAGNAPPTANAGPDQNVNAGANVTLTSASSTDGDGTIVSRLWQQTGGDAVTLSDTTATSPTFTAPSTNAQQDLTFTVTVTDDDGATDTDTVVITVDAVVVAQRNVIFTNSKAANLTDVSGAIFTYPDMVLLKTATLSFSSGGSSAAHDLSQTSATDGQEVIFLAAKASVNKAMAITSTVVES